jgi:hypothetical protein
MLALERKAGKWVQRSRDIEPVFAWQPGMTQQRLLARRIVFELIIDALSHRHWVRPAFRFVVVNALLAHEILLLKKSDFY